MRRSKNKKNNRETGSRHELQAAAFLTDRGYVILEKNYRCRTGEIDLIAKDGGYLVFVEVKFRSSKGSGDPAEAVDAKKKSRIAGAARYYLLTRAGLHARQIQQKRDEVGQAVRLIQDAFWL